MCCVDGLIRPIALVAPASANHKLPSGPVAIPRGLLLASRPDEAPNSSIWPVDGLILPIALFGARLSVNHMLRSAPNAIENGLLPAGRLNSSMWPLDGL